MYDYKKYGTSLVFDTSSFDTGIGEFIFSICYDVINKDYVIYITDVNWDFKYNTSKYYNLMTERKKSINKIINEVINQYLKQILILK
ncbi:hypothetical protein [Hallella sp.]|uniref:hypothetical protein n=1 Tax=Hallella sp. TaxID=2980186 RepID=UPI00308096D4